MGKGWIKLYRQLQECWIWKNKEPFDRRSAWVDLLLSAMHNDTKMLSDNEVIIVNRGSFMTSILKLSERWGWSRGKTDRFLKLLESEQMLNTKRTPVGTLITIVKYEDFQGLLNGSDTTKGTTDSTTDDTTLDTTVEQLTDSQRTTDDTTDGTQNKNIKNIENEKNVNNAKNIEEDSTPPISLSQGGEDKPKRKPKEKPPTVYYPNDELLDSAFKEFLIMRNKIKKPLATKQALTRMMNKIEKLSGSDNDLAVKILNQSTDHCWQDVYELKEDNQSKPFTKNGERDILSEWRNS